MTRETKIGLLVGLAFLLVVGILLSEHITGATEKEAARLADAGREVRTAISAPGLPADVTPPTTPIPTAQELSPKPAPVAPVATAPATPPAAVPPTVVTPTVVAPPAPAVTPAPLQAPTVSVTVVQPGMTRTTIDPFANDPVAKLAAEQGVPVVPVGKGLTDAGRTGAGLTGAGLTAAAATTVGAREVQAQAGDTLSRLAARLPGGNVKANRDAIVKLNPTLQKDPNHVVSGRKYLLPTGPAPLATAEETTGPGTTPAPVDAPIRLTNQGKGPFPTVTPASASDQPDGRVYVVKAGDTLSKIASTELGSKTQVPVIRSMNPDVLKNGDVIKVDMKLKLPAKAGTKQS